jgi:hypothetical protein
VLQDSEFLGFLLYSKTETSITGDRKRQFCKVPHFHPVSLGLFGKVLSADFTGLIVARVCTSIAA